jgi:large subunit ribosomal protein L17
MSNLATSLIIHKRITTTVAKAKELRKYVEPLITKAKSDSTHSRRTAFSTLQNKETIKELFGSVAEKVAGRAGGYTRIIKLGNRKGDNADICIMELVDFNETMLQAPTADKSKTRRSRRSGKKAETSESAVEAKAEQKAPSKKKAESKEEEPTGEDK